MDTGMLILKLDWNDSDLGAGPVSDRIKTIVDDKVQEEAGAWGSQQSQYNKVLDATNKAKAEMILWPHRKHQRNPCRAHTKTAGIPIKDVSSKMSPRRMSGEKMECSLPPSLEVTRAKFDLGIGGKSNLTIKTYKISPIRSAATAKP